MPTTEKTRTKKHGRKPAAPVEDVVKEVAKAPVKRRGRPKGSTNKTTATKSATARKNTARGGKVTGPAKKASATRSKPGPKKMERALDNPFRPNSNAWHYTEALKKGGKRSVIVRNLLKKIDVHPWNEDTYADPHAEVDKRLTMVVKQLETQYGWDVERDGRGAESKVKATPPSERPAKRRGRKPAAV